MSSKNNIRVTWPNPHNMSHHQMDKFPAKGYRILGIWVWKCMSLAVDRIPQTIDLPHYVTLLITEVTFHAIFKVHVYMLLYVTAHNGSGI